MDGTTRKPTRLRDMSDTVLRKLYRNTVKLAGKSSDGAKAIMRELANRKRPSSD